MGAENNMTSIRTNPGRQFLAHRIFLDWGKARLFPKGSAPSSPYARNISATHHTFTESSNSPLMDTHQSLPSFSLEIATEANWSCLPPAVESLNDMRCSSWNSRRNPRSCQVVRRLSLNFGNTTFSHCSTHATPRQQHCTPATHQHSWWEQLFGFLQFSTPLRLFPSMGASTATIPFCPQPLSSWASHYEATRIQLPQRQVERGRKLRQRLPPIDAFPPSRNL